MKIYKYFFAVLLIASMMIPVWSQTLSQDVARLQYYISVVKNMSEVEKLIDQGVDVNSYSNGKTALMWAASSANPDAVVLLLENGADQNLKSYPAQETALMIAIRMAHAHKDINQEKYITALQTAYLLINQSANLNSVNTVFETALSLSVMYKLDTLVERLLKHNANPNLHGYNYEKQYLQLPMIHLAAINGDLKMLNLLIASGARVAEQDSKNAANAIMNLIIHNGKNRFQVVEYLAMRGVNLQQQDGFGNTALHYASAKCDYELINLLLKLGAKASIKNMKGEFAADLLN